VAGRGNDRAQPSGSFVLGVGGPPLAPAERPVRLARRAACRAADARVERSRAAHPADAIRHRHLRHRADDRATVADVAGRAHIRPDVHLRPLAFALPGRGEALHGRRLLGTALAGARGLGDRRSCRGRSPAPDGDLVDSGGGRLVARQRCSPRRSRLRAAGARNGARTRRRTRRVEAGDVGAHLARLIRPALLDRPSPHCAPPRVLGIRVSAARGQLAGHTPMVRRPARSRRC
jgi:hypothetical protein